MKRMLVLVLSCVTIALMILASCERKVVIENAGLTESDNCFVCHFGLARSYVCA